MAFGITSETFKVYIYVKIVFWTDLFIYRTFAITHLECNLQELISCSKMFRFNTDFFPVSIHFIKNSFEIFSSVCPSSVDPVNIVSVEGIIGLIGGARKAENYEKCSVIVVVATIYFCCSLCFAW